MERRKKRRKESSWRSFGIWSARLESVRSAAASWRCWGRETASLQWAGRFPKPALRARWSPESRWRRDEATAATEQSVKTCHTLLETSPSPISIAIASTASRGLRWFGICGGPRVAHPCPAQLIGPCVFFHYKH